ncbi:ubiquitin fusion degradation protein UFD1-domain-containing protein [Pavlovales sp. CCMP2436]|nr:ubiquitin fusion degradation protein UFD1-domain-containing protein [Pavlovales sp. CCMP2436]
MRAILRLAACALLLAAAAAAEQGERPALSARLRAQRLDPATLGMPASFAAGDRILVPRSAFEKLRKRGVPPRGFRLASKVDPSRQFFTEAAPMHCAEGEVCAPAFVLEALGVKEGEELLLENAHLPKAESVRLQAHSSKLAEHPEMESMLTGTLEGFAALTNGTTIELRDGPNVYRVDVIAVRSRPDRRADSSRGQAAKVKVVLTAENFAKHGLSPLQALGSMVAEEVRCDPVAQMLVLDGRVVGYLLPPVGAQPRDRAVFKHADPEPAELLALRMAWLARTAQAIALFALAMPPPEPFAWPDAVKERTFGGRYGFLSGWSAPWLEGWPWKGVFPAPWTGAAGERRWRHRPRCEPDDVAVAPVFEALLPLIAALVVLSSWAVLITVPEIAVRALGDCPALHRLGQTSIHGEPPLYFLPF